MPAPVRRRAPVPSAFATQIDDPDMLVGGPTCPGGWFATGWTGTGSVPASGSTTSATFSITQNSTLAWTWKTQYWLDTGTNGNGSVSVADAWHDVGRDRKSTRLNSSHRT